MSLPADDHWIRWHHAYDDPGSPQARRLGRVRSRVAEVLDAAPAGPLAVLSMCAGQGADLIPVLAGHPRRTEVRALLQELDPGNAAVAARAARSAGLDGVRVVVGDASTTTAYADVVPVDLALVCGVFGNLADDDVRHTVHLLPTLLRPGGRVIWTRHRRDPDLTPAIRGWFVDEGFAEIAFDTEPGYRYGVGTHVLVAGPQPFRDGVTLFRFVGDGGDAAH